MIRCKSRNHVKIVAISKETLIPDDPSKASSDRLRIPGARAPGDLSRTVPQSDVPSQENPGQASGDRLQSSEEESTDLPVVTESSKRPNTSKPTGQHNVSTHVPKCPSCEVCKLTMTARAPYKNRPEACGYRTHHPLIKISDAFTADHKVLKEDKDSRLQHRYAILLFLLYIPRYPTKRVLRDKKVTHNVKPHTTRDSRASK